jgi:hypothetical protein
MEPLGEGCSTDRQAAMLSGSHTPVFKRYREIRRKDGKESDPTVQFSL